MAACRRSDSPSAGGQFYGQIGAVLLALLALAPRSSAIPRTTLFSDRLIAQKRTHAVKPGKKRALFLRNPVLDSSRHFPNIDTLDLAIIRR